MNIFDQLDELERDVDLALDEQRDRVGFAGGGHLVPAALEQQVKADDEAWGPSETPFRRWMERRFREAYGDEPLAVWQAEDR